MRSKTTENEYKSTLSPVQQDSCVNCWNQKMDPEDDSDNPKRHHGIYVSLQVFLVTPEGEYLDVCYKAQCPVCGDIRQYPCKGGGLVPGVYKLACDKYGRMFADAKAEFWPELRRYNLDPRGFMHAVFTHPKEQYFDVANLSKRQSVRHREEFYEPKSERCELYD